LRALAVRPANSGGVFGLLPQQDFGFHSTAMRAFEPVYCKVGAGCMRFDYGQP
jgi:hypothetical protein